MDTKVFGHSIGAVNQTGITFWIGMTAELKTTDVFEAFVEIFEAESDSVFAKIEFDGQPSSQGWFATCNSLKDSSTYDYAIHVSSNSNIYSARGTFTTAPEPDAKSPLKILVTSCIKAEGGEGKDEIQAAWAYVNEQIPDIGLTLMLGDTNYANSIKKKVKWKYTRAQWNIPEFQKYIAKTPVYAIYDDHDFIGQNKVGAGNKALYTKKHKKLTGREKVSQTFNNQWIVSKPENLDESQGCFHKITHGLVDIYMLDTRFYREPLNRKDWTVKLEERPLSLLGSTGHVIKRKKGDFTLTDTKIGNVQWEWLESNFADYKDQDNSNQRVKILCFGSTLKHGEENLSNYPEEIEKLKVLLAGHNNVFFLSGDAHSLKLAVHDEFDVTPNLVEITSSGMGRKKTRDSDIIGGFAVLEIFPEGLDQMVVKFFQPGGTDELPKDEIITLEI